VKSRPGSPPEAFLGRHEGIPIKGVSPSEAPQLEWSKEEHSGKNRLGKLPLGKLRILEVATWEVATWEKSFGKVPNIFQLIKRTANIISF